MPRLNLPVVWVVPGAGAGDGGRTSGRTLRDASHVDRLWGSGCLMLLSGSRLVCDQAIEFTVRIRLLIRDP